MAEHQGAEEADCQELMLGGPGAYGSVRVEVVVVGAAQRLAGKVYFRASRRRA